MSEGSQVPKVTQNSKVAVSDSVCQAARLGTELPRQLKTLKTLPRMKQTQAKKNSIPRSFGTSTGMISPHMMVTMNQ